MPYVAVDKDGAEIIFKHKPERGKRQWCDEIGDDDFVEVPKGQIEKLIGKKLTWEDESIELKEIE